MSPFFLSLIKDVSFILLFAILCIVEIQVTIHKRTVLALVLPGIFLLLSVETIYYTLRNLIFYHQLNFVSPIRLLAFAIILFIFIISKFIIIRKKHEGETE